jgi:hypothetical protein
MILAGTTSDKMQDIYTRLHRNSIYEPATIHDIPFEVLRESFLYLLKRVGSDLASPSLACRAWRVVALDLMNSRKRFVDRDRERVAPFLCGFHLRSIVGLERCMIKQIVLNLKHVGKEFIDVIARFSAPTITSLLVGCGRIASSECYDALDVFFKQCDGIRNLRLEYFDFGDDPITISQIAKDGFACLRQLELYGCRGDIRMFVENAPIPNLKLLRYESLREAAEEYEIITTFATCYRTLTSLKLIVKFDSSASLLKVVECCRDLCCLFFENDGGGLILERSPLFLI